MRHMSHSNQHKTLSNSILCFVDFVKSWWVIEGTCLPLLYTVIYWNSNALPWECVRNYCLLLEAFPCTIVRGNTRTYTKEYGDACPDMSIRACIQTHFHTWGDAFPHTIIYGKAFQMTSIWERIPHLLW